MKKTLFGVVLVVLFFIGEAGAGQFVIKYKYFEYAKLSVVYGAPHDAIVYYTGEGLVEFQVGYAFAYKSVEEDSILKVKETHYNRDESIMYEGYIYFNLSDDTEVCMKVREERISGNKLNNLFKGWPCKK